MSDQELIEYVASKKVTPEELQTVVDITSHPISSIVGALLSSRFNIDLAVESFVLFPILHSSFSFSLLLFPSPLFLSSQ